MRDPRSRGPGWDGPTRRAGLRLAMSAKTAVAWLLALGLFADAARGQAPEPAPPPASDPSAAVPAEEPQDESAKGETQPLSLRYHFVERYVPVADQERPTWLSQYQVGVREKIKVVREKPQGTPDRAETTLQTIYTERALATTQAGVATDVIRRYERAQLTTTVPMRRRFQNPGFLEQLVLWYRIKPGRPVELYNLADERPLRQMEFDRIVENPFLPQVATLLPTPPRRVGDRWPVPRAALAYVVGEMPLEDEYAVEAELTDVRATAPGATTMTAVLGIKGQLLLMEGPVALNIRVHFAFEPPAPKTAGAGTEAGPRAKARAGIVEAEGWISEIRMAEVVTTPIPGDETGRLNQTRTRELVVARRAKASELGPEAAFPLVAPEAPPEDEAHTWVTYDDPEGRFHLKHPQGLKIARAYPEGGVDLVDRRFDGQDVISVALAAKSGDAARDRLLADPAEQRKAMVEQWRAQGQEVLMGDSGWLKEDVWGPLNRKVYRLEAALKPEGEAPAIRGSRIYLDRYIIQFKRDQTLLVTAMTTRDPHVPFRDQAETLIKSFTFGPSESIGGNGAEPVAPAP